MTALRNSYDTRKICPIGFVCDHVEVLYDLDVEAAHVCREVGLPMARAATVNDDPRFLEMMADEVVKTWDRYRTGRPLCLSMVTPAPVQRVERGVTRRVQT